MISGRGSNLVALHEAILAGKVAAEIVLVLSSNPDAQGLQYAAAHNIPTAWLEKEQLVSEAVLAPALLAHLQRSGAQLIVLAGFLKKIPPQVIDAFPNKILNVHPALLPSFGGKGMYGRHVHAAVLAYGCKITGVTVHIVTNEYDAGPPVLQECVAVHADDTPESLAARVLAHEHRLLPRAVDLFARHRIRIAGRNVVVLEENAR